jgi:long-chain-alcohol oxidase
MAANTEAKQRRGHPLLRGRKREGYTHGLHPAQMEALRAMRSALIPSLPVAERLDSGGRGDQIAGGSKNLERFYLASAADGTIPDEVRLRYILRTSDGRTRKQGQAMATVFT